MILKNIIEKGFTALLCLSLITGCDKDGSDFEGLDNYVNSFKIVKGETIYQAAVRGDSIVLTVPEGTLFEGAKAEIGLSENAIIAPDPSSISNWGEEYQFVISSYNQSDRVYKYVIRYSPLSVQGNVVLATQAEVDAFSQKGVSVIDGNLIIGQLSGSDSVFNLKALSALKEVKYNLVIQKNYAAKDLSGFENLAAVGGLKIVSVDSLTDILLPALQSVGTELNVSGSALMSVVLPELKSVGETMQISCASLLRQELSNLETVGGNMTLKASGANLIKGISLPNLKSVGGALSLDSWGKVKTIEIPLLSSCGGASFSSLPLIEDVVFPLLASCTGKLTFSSAGALTSVSCPALTATGGLSFSNCKEVNKIDFPVLAEVSGDISLENLLLSDLTGLKALRQVAGKLNLKALNELSSLSGLVSLKQVGTYTLYNLPEIQEVNVKGMKIDKLELMGSVLQAKIVGDEHFAGNLYINDASDRNITAFPTLQGIRSLEKLEIYNISYLTELMIPGIVRINHLDISSGGKVILLSIPDLTTLGEAKVSYMNSLEEFQMPKLNRVEGDIALSFPSAKTTRLELPELTGISGTLTIQQGTNLETLRFPKLSVIGGALKLSGSSYSKNNALKNLDGFSALTSVGGVAISYYSALVSFEGLKGVVSSLDDSAWNISNNGYNPTLSQMKNGEWIKP